MGRQESQSKVFYYPTPVNFYKPTLIVISHKLAALKNAIVFVFDEFPSFILQMVAASNKPLERVRIQQNIHAIVSLKSANGVSKSGAILILPLALPNLRR